VREPVAPYFDRFPISGGDATLAEAFDGAERPGPKKGTLPGWLPRL
jgi:hypothetical protein